MGGVVLLWEIEVGLPVRNPRVCLTSLEQVVVAVVVVVVVQIAVVVNVVVVVVLAAPASPRIHQVGL